MYLIIGLRTVPCKTEKNTLLGDDIWQRKLETGTLWDKDECHLGLCGSRDIVTHTARVTEAQGAVTCGSWVSGNDYMDPTIQHDSLVPDNESTSICSLPPLPAPNSKQNLKKRTQSNRRLVSAHLKIMPRATIFSPCKLNPIVCKSPHWPKSSSILFQVSTRCVQGRNFRLHEPGKFGQRSSRYYRILEYHQMDKGSSKSPVKITIIAIQESRPYTANDWYM